MKILKDGFRADMERIKRELTALQGVSIHVGILGDAGSDILMIAGVHEYGATISAKNVKHLAIPLNMEAKNAGSPRKFNDLRFIPISPGYGFLVRDRKHPQKAPGRKKQEKHDAKKHPSGGEEDPFVLHNSRAQVAAALVLDQVDHVARATPIRSRLLRFPVSRREG